MEGPQMIHIGFFRSANKGVLLDAKKSKQSCEQQLSTNKFYDRISKLYLFGYLF